jgi:large subunit ribosomal protein L3
MASKAIVGEKVGMTQVWGDDNRVVPVTMVKVAPLRVVQVKTVEHDGYNAVQVTFGRTNGRTLSKPKAGHFEKAGVEPGRRVVELRLDDVSGFEVGQELKVGVHRAPGAIGACATPSRVFRGTRMAGRLGGQRVTTLNLEVVSADAERDLLLVKGAVPGPKGGLVVIRDAVKAVRR